MRFVIEQRYLTDSIGAPIADYTSIVSSRDGADARAVLAGLVADDGATSVGAVMLYRGEQALLFARKADTVYTLYAYPADRSDVCKRFDERASLGRLRLA